MNTSASVSSRCIVGVVSRGRCIVYRQCRQRKRQKVGIWEVKHRGRRIPQIRILF